MAVATADRHVSVQPERPGISANVVTGALLAIPGWVLGWTLGQVTGLNSELNTSVTLGYLFATIFFLIGMGFLNYPISRFIGRPVVALREHYPEDRSWTRYFTATPDHKVVGIQYLIMIFVVMILGASEAVLIRTNLLYPDRFVVPPGHYIELIGLHGTTMIFMASAAVVGPLGNFLVPLMIGSRRMAFPRLEALTFWLVPPAVVILFSSIFWGGFPTGWTGYPPLSEEYLQGFTAYGFAFGLIALALFLTALNMIATIVALRAPGMTWTRLPLFVWGVLSFSLAALLAAPVLTAAIVMQVLDRTVSTSFFLAPNGGTPFLWENLFWFFGHPEVYLFILPAFGIILEMLPVFARKPLWGYRIAVVGLLGVALLSFFVWQHHLFVSGIAPALRPFFTFSTEMISIPTGIIFLVGMGTLWRARIWVTVPMLFVAAFFWNFLIGGITGIFNSDVPTDVTLHGSYWVMSHFHYTIVGGEVFAFVGALYYWWPKLTGKMLNTTLGVIHWALMFVSFNMAFLPLFILGIADMPRRVSSYAPNLQFGNDWVSIWAYILIFSMVIFAGNVIYTWFFSTEFAPANPWLSRGLEWQVGYPVPVNNFARVPRILAPPYDYGVPDALPVAELEPAAVTPAAGSAPA